MYIYIFFIKFNRAEIKAVCLSVCLSNDEQCV